MFALALRPRARLLLRVVFTVVLTVAYVLPIGTAMVLAPEVAYRLTAGDHSYWLATYTLISCCLPIALGLSFLLRGSRLALSVRARRVLTVLVVLNWFPLCMANFVWAISMCQGCWVD
jgi:hypothetical protein